MLLTNIILTMSLLLVDGNSQNCNTEFEGFYSDYKKEKDFTFASYEQEKTFNIQKCDTDVVGVKVSACNEYPFYLKVVGPNSVYYSRSVHADGQLKVHVEVFCASLDENKSKWDNLSTYHNQ